MSNYYFAATADGLAPEPLAHAPWAENMLHGRLLGGVAARSLENEFAEPGWRIARLTVDLFRPAAMAPVQVATTTIRSGRKIKLADAVITCEGHEVGRVTALLLTEGQEPPGVVWRPNPSPWPDPESMENLGNPTEPPDDTGWLFRTVEGGMGTGEQSRIWTNDTLCLVDDEPMSPIVRAAVSGDIACPLANSGTEGLFYINADYTMMLGRYPQGDWIGVEVNQQIEANGISMASATMVDRLGPFATSSGVSLTRPPLELPQRPEPDPPIS